MNSSGSTILPSKENSLRAGSKKSSRKKKQRAKWLNYYLKRRRFRKFNDVKKANFSQSNNFYDTLNTQKIMSNWYWYNYNKSLEWQDRHQLAHWKATALALLEENRYLLEIIKNMQPSMVPGASVTQSDLHNVSNTNKSEYKISPSENVLNYGTSNHNYNPDREEEEEEGDEEDEEDEEVEGHEENEENVGYLEDVEDEEDEGNGDNEDENDGNDDSDFELEMSKEMMQFFEQSQKHKMELKKLKEKELEEKTEKEIEEIKISKVKRTSEMNFLYGEGASMITGMETAVQLGFNKYCDNKSPKFWPNIPFRL